MCCYSFRESSGIWRAPDLDVSVADSLFGIAVNDTGIMEDELCVRQCFPQFALHPFIVRRHKKVRPRHFRHLLPHLIRKQRQRTVGDRLGVIGTSDMHPHRLCAKLGKQRFSLLQNTRARL